MTKTRKQGKCNFKNITRKHLVQKMIPKGFDLFNISYNEPVKKDLAVGLVYFNSAKSKRLLMNYLYIREKFKIANIPTYTVEMYESTPEISDAIHLKTDFILFQKERLCYVLEKHIPEQYTKLLFIDTDLVFDNVNWYNDLSLRLDTINIVQPFSNALWLDLTYRKIVKYRVPITFYLKFGEMNKDGNLGGYHPGFAWAFQRAWYRKHGFFQYGILGGGDFFSSTVWVNRCWEDNFTRNKWNFIIPALKEYSESLKESPSICYIKGAIFHLWHGDREKRQYNERSNIFRGVNDIRDIISVQKNGIFSLKKNKLKSKILKYFRNRDDDGL